MDLNNFFNIAEKTIVISGATGFFGKSFIKAFSSLGANVIALSRSERIKQVINEEELSHIDAFVIDFYDKDNLDKTLDEIAEKYPKIDVLINNAYDFSRETGFNTEEGELFSITPQMFFKGLDTGIFWPFITSQKIGEKMVGQKNGSIINISSMYGVVSPDSRLYEGKSIFNPAAYSIAKSAILAMTRYFASFLGKYGIRCNAVSPGAFPNTQGDSYNSNQDQEMIERLEKRTVLGRTGTPDDLLGALVLLSSDASTYITGQNIIIDGGWTAI
jgi:NAD(P)-dependent dehydrogenase (short-subunit alcohol dehydrogenase family)